MPVGSQRVCVYWAVSSLSGLAWEVWAEMLSVESLQVAEEEVVESSSNKLGDIYTFVAKGCFPQTMNPLRKKNLKRYAQKFIIDGKPSFTNWTKHWEYIALALVNVCWHHELPFKKPGNLKSPCFLV